MDENFIVADENVAAAKDGLDRTSKNLPFLRRLTVMVEEIESIQDQLSEAAAALYPEVGPPDSIFQGINDVRAARRLFVQRFDAGAISPCVPPRTD